MGLIDKSTLYRTIKSMRAINVDTVRVLLVGDVLKVIQDQSEIHAAPIREAFWVRTLYGKGNSARSVWLCSSCNKRADSSILVLRQMHYCPCCGAKIVGEKNISPDEEEYYR